MNRPPPLSSPFSRSRFSALPGPVAGQRIGLFGGSFNPAHSGHRHVADTALKRLKLDWIWWLVAGGNPLKSNHGDASARLQSAKAAANHPRMIATDLEAQQGLTYTCDTLAWLHTRAPEAQFVWLIGSDNLAGFHKWRDWRGIAETVPIAVIARPGRGAQSGARARHSPFARTYDWARLPQSMAPALAEFDAPAWTYLTAPLNPASSTAIRAARARP